MTTDFYEAKYWALLKAQRELNSIQLRRKKEWKKQVQRIMSAIDADPLEVAKRYAIDLFKALED